MMSTPRGNEPKAVRRAPRFGAWLGIAALLLSFVGIFGSGAAQAQVSRASSTTCPTDSTGMPACPPPVVTISLHLTIHFVKSPTGNDNLDEIAYQVCGIPAPANGTSVQLFIDGVAVTAPGGSGPIVSAGCTTDLNIIGCLAPGTHSTYAFVNGIGNTETESLVVPNDVVCTSTTAPTTSSNGGALAFTGSNIFRAVIAAALIILLGLAITTAARKKKRHS